MMGCRPRPTNYFPVHGTGSFRIGQTGDWWQVGSRFQQRLYKENIVLSKPDDVFFWSSALDGVLGGEETWYAAAAALRYYLQDVEPSRRNIIAHSHGCQVVMLCAAGTCYPSGLIRPMHMNNVILVDPPLRKDMQETYNQGRHFIRKLVHIGDGSWNRMKRWGRLFGGWHRFSLEMKQAHINIIEKGIGHSKLFTHPEVLEMAISKGWFEHLR